LEADIPTLEDHLRTYLQRPDVLEQLKPLEEAPKRFIDFFAMVGLMIVKMAELPPSRGYEPLLMIQYGVDRILARGMARIVMPRQATRRGRSTSSTCLRRHPVFSGAPPPAQRGLPAGAASP
jgi:hypothetical protein